MTVGGRPRQARDRPSQGGQRDPEVILGQLVTDRLKEANEILRLFREWWILSFPVIQITG